MLVAHLSWRDGRSYRYIAGNYLGFSLWMLCRIVRWKYPPLVNGRWPLVKCEPKVRERLRILRSRFVAEKNDVAFMKTKRLIALTCISDIVTLMNADRPHRGYVSVAVERYRTRLLFETFDVWEWGRKMESDFNRNVKALDDSVVWLVHGARPCSIELIENQFCSNWLFDCSNIFRVWWNSTLEKKSTVKKYSTVH